MKITDIKEILDATYIAGAGSMDEEIDYGYGCDLMSDVPCLCTEQRCPVDWACSSSGY